MPPSPGAPALLPDNPHDRRLRDLVHPADWNPPVPLPRYDLVVLGAGTAGLVAAAGAAGLGATVALVERDLMGGDCLNTGCVPSKGVLVAGKAARSGPVGLARLGIGGEGGIDFGAAMDRMRRIRARIAHADSAPRFAALGVHVFLGNGRFTGRDTLTVGAHTLRFRRAVLATGAAPSAPPIPGIDTLRPFSSEDWFSQTSLPARCVVVGAGPIGVEMAQAFARMGSDVLVLDRAERVLPREDPDASRLLAEALVADGVRLGLGATISALRGEGGRGGTVLWSDGVQHEDPFDAMLLATGRRARLADIGLERAGVEVRDGRLALDERLRTSNRRIFAAGDVAGRAQFTHAADAMARIVLTNGLFPGRARYGGLVVPWATYTDPEVAQVGLTAEGAAEAGIAIDTYTVDFGDVDRSQLEGESGFVRAHVKRGSDQLVGATIAGHGAGDLIGVFSLLMTEGLGLGVLGKTIQPYPSRAMALKQLGNEYNRSRGTPTVMTALGLFRKAWRALV